MAEEPSIGVLSKLLSGEPLPLIPLPEKISDPKELYAYIQRLHDYLRRMWGRFNSTNIFYEIINNPPTDPPAGLLHTVNTDWRYDASTHKFQKKTRQVASLFVGAESAWTDTGGNQPVNFTRVVANVDYNTTTHVLSEDHRADVYVLDIGALTSGTNVNTADPCSV